MAYATLADFDAWLFAGNDTPPGDDSALRTTCLLNAQAIIESAVDRVFEASADTTKYFDAELLVDAPPRRPGGSGLGRGRRTLYLDGLDLCQITTITNGDGDVIPSDQYVTEPRNSTPYFAITLTLNADTIWTWETRPENAITITGRWAYSLAAPPDIKQACVRLAAFLYRQKDTQADLDRPVMTGDGVTIMPGALPKDIREILAPYRRLV